MGSIQLKLSKIEVATMISIGFYWGWVLTIFYNSSFRATEFPSSTIGLWNIGAHVSALILCSLVLRWFSSPLQKRAYVLGAAIIAAIGTISLFTGAIDRDPLTQIAGSIASGIGSAALLLCWGGALGRVEADNRRRNVLCIAILIAVALYVVVATFPPALKVTCSMAMIVACGIAVLQPFTEEQDKTEDIRRHVLTQKARKATKMKWWSLLLCTFLFSIPLVYFRVGESSVELSVFSSMLPCLCLVFLVDFLLRKCFNHSVMPHLFVLLTSGGMILLPFLVQGDVFLVGLLIHMGGWAFRAYAYPEFVKTALYLGKSPAICCALGTVAIDLGQVIGTFMRNSLIIQSDQWFTHATLGIAYALFLAAFLFFTHRFDVEQGETRQGKGSAVSGKTARSGSSAEKPMSIPSKQEIGSTPDSSSDTFRSFEQNARDGSPTASHPMIAGIEQQCDLVARRYGLSAKETEVLKLVVRGRTGMSISEELVVSPNTVKTHISHIYRKCCVHSREELVTLVESEASC